jgi:hypothetical protein
MTTDNGYPEEMTQRQVLLQQLMQYALEQGQTGIASRLLDLRYLCDSLDFQLTNYCDHAYHLEEALGLLLTALENMRDQRLSAEALQYLIAPIRRYIDQSHGGSGTLN